MQVLRLYFVLWQNQHSGGFGYFLPFLKNFLSSWMGIRESLGAVLLLAHRCGSDQHLLLLNLSNPTSEHGKEAEFDYLPVTLSYKYSSWRKAYLSFPGVAGGRNL